MGHSWQGLLNRIHGIGISLACIYLYQESSLSIYYLQTSILVGRSGKRRRIISVAGSRRSCTRSITSLLRLFIVIPISIVRASLLTSLPAGGSKDQFVSAVGSFRHHFVTNQYCYGEQLSISGRKGSKNIARRNLLNGG